MTFHKTSVAFVVTILGSIVFASHPPSLPRTITEGKYSTAHSLGDDYVFDPRDGWQSTNATDLQYKYARQSLRNEEPNEGTTLNQRKSSALGDTISMVTGSLKKVFEGFKGLGEPEDAVITWYTGNDLLNPSCWSKGNWAPTDASFACALTLEGWKDRPECFKFLEVCHTPQKCIFVRVVDTCAGCAPGTKHIDLTKAAFGQLGRLDDGRLPVKYRHATEPDTWFEKLWGPRIHHVEAAKFNESSERHMAHLNSAIKFNLRSVTLLQTQSDPQAALSATLLNLAKQQFARYTASTEKDEDDLKNVELNYRKAKTLAGKEHGSNELLDKIDRLANNIKQYKKTATFRRGSADQYAGW